MLSCSVTCYMTGHVMCSGKDYDQNVRCSHKQCDITYRLKKNVLCENVLL